MDRKHKTLLALAATIDETGPQYVEDTYKRFLSNTTLALFTLDFATVQQEYLDVCYNGLYRHSGRKSQSHKHSSNEQMNQIHVDSEIRKGMVENVNHLHCCKLCLQRGQSEADSRNVSAKSFVYRADEAMITQLTCNACGHKWKA